MNSVSADDQSAFSTALLAVNRLAARTILHHCLATYPPDVVAETLITPTLETIGNGWEAGHVALAQVYMSSRICEELVATLFPDPTVDEAAPVAIVVLEDHHLLGKRIVTSVLRAAGIALRDYGRLEADELISRVQQDSIKILLISALMLRSALRINYVRDQLIRQAIKPRIIVGGAPFRLDHQLWQEVGADATADNAAAAIPILKAWLP